MKDIVLRITKNLILRSLTVEAVQDFLKKALELARQGANSTQNKIDDWVVDFIEQIVKDPTKVELLVKRIKELLQIQESRICLSPDSDVFTQYLLTCYFTGYEPLEREVAFTRCLVETLVEAGKAEA